MTSNCDAMLLRACIALLGGAAWTCTLPSSVCAQAAVTQVIATSRLESGLVFTGRRFTQIDGVRELPDGRVIVADSREGIVVIADFVTQQSTRTGRTGNGTGEYLSALALFVWPGSRTALLDGRNSRVLLFDRNGRPDGTIDLGLVETAPGSLSRFVPFASDSRGRFYAAGSSARMGMSGLELADSVAIERWQPESGRLDTAGYLRARSLLDRGGQPGSTKGLGGPALIPFVIGDQVAVDTVGRLAILRWDDFRVDYVLPAGAVSRGPTLPFDSIRVTEVEKRVWREARQVQMCRSVRSPIDEPPTWPEFLPPFLGRPALFAPDGKLWIRRTVPADSPPLYDVVDQNATLAARVELPPRSCVMGFGEKSVYVVTNVAIGSQQLARHQLPVFR